MRIPKRVAGILVAGLLLLSGCGTVASPYWKAITPTSPEGRQLAPSPAPREFRGAWVATVANIDWPSRAGLSVAEQQAEIVAIVARAQELKLNALILQVRPSADALYESSLEPWSEYLTGEQGRAPSPFYDPLKTWITEAHRRGIALHAWFNPYRARHSRAQSALVASHVAVTSPNIVKKYGDQLWLDPGEPLAAQKTLDVILDVVRRYDIDGVHLDDYFYPYPVAAPAGMPKGEIDFPDEPSWRAWLATRQRTEERLTRADWRRQNVSNLVEKIYRSVHAIKPWLPVGISPFGIGKPDRRPQEITGFSQYDKLYADVEEWLSQGWLDYLAPQLYWPIEQKPQAFGTLLAYWQKQNIKERAIWPGLYSSRVESDKTGDAAAKREDWNVDQIIRQVALTRSRVESESGGLGHIHFSMVALMDGRRGLAQSLAGQSYETVALVPSLPWLGEAPPQAPSVNIENSDADKINIQIVSQDAVQFAGWLRYGQKWHFAVWPAEPNVPLSMQIIERNADGLLNTMVFSAIGRQYNESEKVMWQLR